MGKRSTKLVKFRLRSVEATYQWLAAFRTKLGTKSKIGYSDVTGNTSLEFVLLGTEMHLASAAILTFTPANFRQ